MRLSDEAIVDGVTRYRESVGGRHGPPALTYLARYLKSEGLVEEEPSKALLSIRIRKLVDQGRLFGTEVDGGISAFSLEENPDWDGNQLPEGS